MIKERVLVTGGASGIGASCAKRCIEDGYDVIIVDRIGDGILADLSDVEQTASALEKALQGGPITRLINNVGIVRPADIEHQSLEDLDAVFAVNTRCAMQCAKALLPSMKEAGFGRIVNVTSRAALGKELRSAYAASKAALIGLTRVWSLELGRYGITTNAIGPGPIRTTLFEKVNPAGDPRTEAIIRGIPVQRVGEPEDVAQAVSFFLDRRSGFVTGQTLYVCGGMTVGASGI